jgi:hypothetical protein
MTPTAAVNAALSRIGNEPNAIGYWLFSISY